MDVAGALTAARRRREAQTRLMREGLDVWRCRQQQLLAKKAHEQKQLREMLLTYSPWGRPGGGAPNSDTIRKRKALQLEMLYGTSPPPATSPTASTPPSTTTGPLAAGMASSGASSGASGCHTLPRLPSEPRHAANGNETRRLRCDPQLLFQFQEADRRAVDNLLRYRTDPRQQEQYRRDLDRMVQEKRLRQQQQQQKQQQQHQRSLHHQQHDRSGPQQQGGHQEHDEANAHEGHVRRRRSAGAPSADTAPKSTAGVELVPLLDRRRHPLDEPLSPLPRPRARANLPTTDVTNVTKVKEEVSHEKEQTWRDLAAQIDRKKRQMEATRADELERSRQHFETWQMLWGRPGHGAPRDIKVKENLDMILYHHLDRAAAPAAARAAVPEQAEQPATPAPCNAPPAVAAQ